jgi:DNA-binding NarL/FixJ family response regulator
MITDLVMPECEGLDTMMRLRESHPGLPIVAISGAFGGRFLLARRCSAPALLWASRSAATTC